MEVCSESAAMNLSIANAEGAKEGSSGGSLRGEKVGFASVQEIASPVNSALCDPTSEGAASGEYRLYKRRWLGLLALVRSTLPCAREGYRVLDVHSLSSKLYRR